MLANAPADVKAGDSAALFQPGGFLSGDRLAIRDNMPAKAEPGLAPPAPAAAATGRGAPAAAATGLAPPAPAHKHAAPPAPEGLPEPAPKEKKKGKPKAKTQPATSVVEEIPLVLADPQAQAALFLEALHKDITEAHGLPLKLKKLSCASELSTQITNCANEFAVVYEEISALVNQEETDVDWYRPLFERASKRCKDYRKLARVGKV